jgi:hypothetical protein
MLSYRFSRIHVTGGRKKLCCARKDCVKRFFPSPHFGFWLSREASIGESKEEEKKATKIHPSGEHGGHIVINCKSFNGGTQQINLITAGKKTGNLKANWGINVKNMMFQLKCK